MHYVMVRYTLKPERVAENEELVRAVFEELATTQPDGLQYATLKLDDGVSFVHIAATSDPGLLSEVAAFARFKENLGDRCEEPPVRTPAEIVGSFGLFGSAVGA